VCIAGIEKSVLSQKPVTTGMTSYRENRFELKFWNREAENWYIGQYYRFTNRYDRKTGAETGKPAIAQIVKKDRKMKFFLFFFLALLISLLCMPYVWHDKNKNSHETKKTHVKYHKSLAKNKHMHEVAQIIVDIYNLVWRTW
jgi:hypothetical protein